MTSSEGARMEPTNKESEQKKPSNQSKVSEGGKKYIGAIDQGTSSSRFILFPIDEDSTTTGTICSQKEIPKITAHGKTEWVEQCPEAIFQSVVDCIEDVVGRILPAKGGSAEDILTVGITNQRESTILWDRATGKDIFFSFCLPSFSYPAIGFDFYFHPTTSSQFQASPSTTASSGWTTAPRSWSRRFSRRSPPRTLPR